MLFGLNETEKNIEFYEKIVFKIDNISFMWYYETEKNIEFYKKGGFV